VGANASDRGEVCRMEPKAVKHEKQQVEQLLPRESFCLGVYSREVSEVLGVILTKGSKLTNITAFIDMANKKLATEIGEIK